MDWSSVYEENGDESGNFTREDDMSVSMRAGVLDSLKVYNPYVCYAFTVNYILGVGCLGIPYAFYRSGIVLGSLLIVFLSFISYTTVMWIAETSHRGMQQRLDSCSKNPFRSPKLTRRRKPRNKRVVSSEATTPDAMKLSSLNPFIGNGITSYFISNVKEEVSAAKLDDIKVDEKDAEYLECSELEVTELTQDLLGSKGFVLFQTSLSVLTYVGLLAYTQVFIQSFKSEIWPGAPSVIPNLIFGLLVVPLSCCDLAEQIAAQVLMSCLRFFSLGILVAGALAAFYINGPQDRSHTSSSILINRRGVPLIEFNGFGIMFTTAIFRFVKIIFILQMDNNLVSPLSYLTFL
jgi:Transmembrane amino acid transporter protein